MLILYRVTFTGIDKYTNLHDLLEFARHYPIVEFGILYSAKQSSTRYPSINEITTMISVLRNNWVRISLHICGSSVYDFLQGEEHTNNLVQMLDDYDNGRVQLNVPDITRVSSESIRRACNQYPSVNFILQLNQKTQDFCYPLLESPDLSFLYDASLGSGVVPAEYKAIAHNSFTGYAGGISPDNVLEVLAKIKQANLLDIGHHMATWIDMESGVRSLSETGVSLFDLEKCKSVLDAIDCTYQKDSSGRFLL